MTGKGRTGADPAVAIVGAGIGGLSAAAALRSHGIGCTVYEGAAELGELGAGLQLAPNATRLLAHWGLLEAVRAVGVSLVATVIRRWDDGRALAATRWQGPAGPTYGAPMLAVHRADLQRVLAGRLDTGVLRLGHRLAGLAPGPDGVTLRFEGGGQERAQVVVGADGIRSTVRAGSHPDRPVPCGQSILRALVPADEVPARFRQPYVQVWVGPGRHAVVYPVRGGRLVNVAATVPAAPSPAPVGESWSRTVDTGELLAAYRGWHGELGELFARLPGLQRFDLHDREPLDQWSEGAVTLLGDAAHPMLPFFAQGANQALEDAAGLAGALAVPGTPVPDALRDYQRRRMPRTAAVQWSARLQTDWLHLPDGAEQRHRDQGFAQPSPGRLGWLYAHDASRREAPATGSASLASEGQSWDD